MKPQDVISEVLDHARGMWRFRWLTVGIAWLIAVSGWIYVYSMPDVYGASAQVFVDTNTLLRPLMQGLTADQNPLDEVQLMSREVRSRPNLQRVAYDTDLILEAETPEDEEAIVTALQTNITVASGRENVFTISYQHSSREQALDVVRAVLVTFVENSLGNQGEDVESSERALLNELETLEQRLREAEDRRAEFKRENIGYMPGDGGDYYARLQAAEAQVEGLSERIRQLTQRREELSRQIEGEEPVFGIVTPQLGQGGGGCVHSAQIASLENELAQLELNFTERHPRIERLQELIDSLQQQCDTALQSALESGAGLLTPPTNSSEEPLELNPVYQNLRIRLSDTELELVELRSELQTGDATLARLERDVDKILEVEKELEQLDRGYEGLVQRHQQVLSRYEDLQAKKRLDSETDSVQFRIIEPPFALADPVGPNRPLLLSVTLLFSIGASLAIAFSLNQVQPAFFTRQMLGSKFDLPVIGAVSMIMNHVDRVRQRKDMFAWTCVGLTLLVCFGLVIGFAGPASELTRELLEEIGL